MWQTHIYTKDKLVSVPLFRLYSFNLVFLLKIIISIQQEPLMLMSVYL